LILNLIIKEEKIMAAPNMLALTTITGSNANVAIGVGATSLASNAAASSQVWKINSLYISNSSASAVTVTVNYYSAAALGGSSFPITSAVSIPGNSTLVAVTKDANLYLTENTSLGALAGTGATLTATITYEVCS
jgi:hypothetical protein